MLRFFGPDAFRALSASGFIVEPVAVAPPPVVVAISVDVAVKAAKAKSIVHRDSRRSQLMRRFHSTEEWMIKRVAPSLLDDRDITVQRSRAARARVQFAQMFPR